jgi:hypothetical protein
MATKLKIEKRGDEILIVHFNCSYMPRSILTYILRFSVKCFFQPIAVRHNFERDPPCQVWLNLVQWFLRRRFKCDLLSKYA